MPAPPLHTHRVVHTRACGRWSCGALADVLCLGVCADSALFALVARANGETPAAHDSALPNRSLGGRGTWEDLPLEIQRMIAHICFKMAVPLQCVGLMRCRVPCTRCCSPWG